MEVSFTWLVCSALAFWLAIQDQLAFNRMLNARYPEVTEPIYKPADFAMCGFVALAGPIGLVVALGFWIFPGKYRDRLAHRKLWGTK